MKTLVEKLKEDLIENNSLIEVLSSVAILANNNNDSIKENKDNTEEVTQSTE